jgi:hypothetical protein
MLVKLENLNLNSRLLTQEFNNLNLKTDHYNSNLNKLKIAMLTHQLTLPKLKLLMLLHRNTLHLHHPINMGQQLHPKQLLLLMEQPQVKNQAMEEQQELLHPPAHIKLVHHTKLVEDQLEQLVQLIQLAQLVLLVLQALMDHMDQLQELDQVLDTEH